jgi:U1 small nuclear ribonucleoprotein
VKLKGYIFIEFLHERDMKYAYKDADGIKLHEKRILVDFEHTRTIKNWLSRRLTGVLDATRSGSENQNTKTSGRIPLRNIDQKQAIYDQSPKHDDYPDRHEHDRHHRDYHDYDRSRDRDRGHDQATDHRHRRIYQDNLTHLDRSHYNRSSHYSAIHIMKTSNSFTYKRS